METTFREISQWAGILGSLFYHDPASEKGATALRFVSGQEAAQAWPFGQPEAQTCLETMAKAAEDDGLHEIHLEYNRLFIGPSKLPAPAWGSVYLDPENVIFGIETLELREWMCASGVNMTLAEKEPEDQFGLMLMMAAFCTTAAKPQCASCLSITCCLGRIVSLISSKKVLARARSMPALPS